jgi:putative FmdB family regulatory protein
MPTYVYRCQSCSTLQEAVQRITADPLTTCESCSGPLRRVLQPVGIVFKGSGFYVTDYKRAEGGAKSTPSTDGKPDGGKSEGGESKPAVEKTEKKEPAPAATAAS